MKKLLRQLLFYSALFCYHHAFAQIAYMPSLRGALTSIPKANVITNKVEHSTGSFLTFSGSITFLTSPAPTISQSGFVYSSESSGNFNPTIEDNDNRFIVSTTNNPGFSTNQAFTLNGVMYARAYFITNSGVYYGNVVKFMSAKVYNYTLVGNPGTYTVPSYITSITIKARGGRGGNAPDSSTPDTTKGGNPALTHATFNVNPGDIIEFYIGQNGMQVPNTVAPSYQETTTAGGGGASWVFNKTQSDKLLMVAGGGGGAYAGTYGFRTGGNASITTSGISGAVVTGSGATALTVGTNGNSGTSTKWGGQVPAPNTSMRASGGAGGGYIDNGDNLSVAKGYSFTSPQKLGRSTNSIESNAFYGGGGFGGGGGGYAFRSGYGSTWYYSGAGGGGGGYSGGGAIQLDQNRRGGGSGGGGGSYINNEATSQQPTTIISVNGGDSEGYIVIHPHP